MSAAPLYGFQLPAGRQPENRYLGELDADGYVIRLHELAAGDGPSFFDAIRKTRDLYPLDPKDIILPRPIRLSMPMVAASRTSKWDAFMSEGNAVAKRDSNQVLDLTTAQASKKFLEAYSGRIGQMNPDQQSMFLMALGQVLGVKAELGELILFQGKPYLSYDGRLRLAHASGLLVGLDVRPASPMERRNYGCADGDVLFVSIAQRRGAAGKFTGWGHVRSGEKNPVTKSHPQEMAKKRARYDALRAAFPAAESITPMHARYIEEAEADIRAGKALHHPAMQALTEGDEMPDESEEGHEAATGTEQPPEPQANGLPEHEGDGTLALGDAPKRPKSRNAQLD